MDTKQISLEYAAMAFLLLRTTLFWLLLLTGCTLVYIEGDANSISDTGGHGGVTLPAAVPAQPTLADRLRGLNAAKH